MDKIKLLRFLVISLFIINLITIGSVFLTKKGEHSRHERPRNVRPSTVIIEKLNFDSAQQADYMKLIEQHRSEIGKIEQDRAGDKKALYFLLNEGEQSSKDSILELLAAHQLKIESIHFNHFVDIRNLCKQDQLKDFESLSKELGHLFHRKKR